MGTDGEVVGRETLDKGRSILSICRQSRPPLYESHQKARNRMDDDPAKPWSPAQVAFDYIKGNSFRRLRPSIDAAMERSARDFDDNEKMAAKKASLESMSIMDSLDFGDLPFVEFSDSGILTLQWAREGRGVLLSFSGDGVFGFSIKRSLKDSYSETYQEREVKDGVDPDTRSEISWISNIGSDAEAA